MTPDASVTALIADLHAKRRALQASIDAVDLVLENLARVYPAAAPPGAVGSAAAARRAELLELLRARGGLTMPELRAVTPRMPAPARRNALQVLKVHGAIKRVHRKWVAV
jgi:hypothetical protein